MELKLKARAERNKAEELLIVPYGIETIQKIFFIIFRKTFNRTLWN